MQKMSLKENLAKVMALIDSNSSNITNGDYLELSNLLKNIHNNIPLNLNQVEEEMRELISSFKQYFVALLSCEETSELGELYIDAEKRNEYFELKFKTGFYDAWGKHLSNELFLDLQRYNENHEDCRDLTIKQTIDTFVYHYSKEIDEELFDILDEVIREKSQAEFTDACFEMFG